MGLLLSVLVTCVGVIELLTFYYNLERRVNLQPIQTNLTIVQDQYLKELEIVKDSLTLQLQKLKNVEIASNQAIPALRLNSYENFDIKFLEQAVAQSPSIQFINTEKNCSSSTSTTLRKSQEKQGIKKSRAQECLPEYLIEEIFTSDVPRNVIKKYNDRVSLPSPENEKIFKIDVFKKKLGHSNIELDGELYYRRSPFPTFDLTVPQNSVCGELLNDFVSIAEVNEYSDTNLHSCVDVEAIHESEDLSEINNNYEKSNIMLKSATYNLTSNKNLAIPSNDLLKSDVQKHKSRSESESLEFTSDIQPCSKIGSNLELLKQDKNRIISKIKDESDLAEANNSVKSTGLPAGKNTNTNNLMTTTSLNENTSNSKPGEPFWVNC